MSLGLADIALLTSTIAATTAVVVLVVFYARRLRRAAAWREHAREWHVVLLGYWAVSRLVKGTWAYIDDPDERDWRMWWDAHDNVILYAGLYLILRVILERIRAEHRRDRRAEDRGI